jgi:hypothetical protein
MPTGAGCQARGRVLPPQPATSRPSCTPALYTPRACPAPTRHTPRDAGCRIRTSQMVTSPADKPTTASARQPPARIVQSPSPAQHARATRQPIPGHRTMMSRGAEPRLAHPSPVPSSSCAYKSSAQASPASRISSARRPQLPPVPPSR